MRWRVGWSRRVVEVTKEGAREGLKALRTFQGLVYHKREEEEGKEGWQSRASNI